MWQQNIINVIIMSNSFNHSQTIKQDQLNYHSRKKGKPSKPKKFERSPLHDTSLSTLIISSRCRSKSGNSQADSNSDSIIWLNQVKMDEPEKILIVEPTQPLEMLIVESQEQDQTEQLGGLDASRCQKEPNRATSPSLSQKNKTSILICEETEDLLWIDKSGFQQENSPYQQSFNTTQTPSYFQQQLQATTQHYRNVAMTHFQELSNIEELSSRAEQDIEEHLWQQNLGKAPISPQTQPLLKARPQKLYNQIFDEKSWIKDQGCSSPIDFLTEEQPFTKAQKFRLKIDMNEMFGQNCSKAGQEKKEPRSLLLSQKNQIFQTQLKQLNQIKNSTSKQNKDSILQIISILEQEKDRLKEKLLKQQCQIRQYKCSLKARTKLLSPDEVDLQFASKSTTANQEEQIRLNSRVLIRLLQLIKSK